jgi:hypothetical protein
MKIGDCFFGYNGRGGIQLFIITRLTGRMIWYEGLTIDKDDKIFTLNRNFREEKDVWNERIVSDAELRSFVRWLFKCKTWRTE